MICIVIKFIIQPLVFLKKYMLFSLPNANFHDSYIDIVVIIFP